MLSLRKPALFGAQSHTASWSIKITVIVLAGLTIISFGLVGATFSAKPAPSNSITVKDDFSTVTALGRLEPKGELIQLAAPSASGESRIDRFLVVEGQKVRKGQVIAILDSHPSLSAAVAEAEMGVELAKSKLEIVRAGAKQGERDSQEAEIDRLKAELRTRLVTQDANLSRLELEAENAKVELARYKKLHEEQVVSDSEYDRKKLAFESVQKAIQESRATKNQIESTVTEQLRSAKAVLRKISEVRSVDLKNSEIEVERARASVQLSKAKLRQSLIVAPIDGTIIKVHTKVGEKIGSNGVADLGNIDEMYAVAEVYQTDVAKIRKEQSAIISADVFPDVLFKGKVVSIGRRVKRQNVINSDPTANIDERIVDVKVQLDDQSSKRLSGFTDLQVKVAISI
ncbi:MAG: efflux RND transporter periplasmic adaptor subunit [Candidatus Obscuribacterales bacterium]|nr:efflux RND transporter periplasmic adaptor subunit [Candidatus Obscuribacterales bacterium]